MGIEFMDDETLSILRTGGAEVEGQLVRFPPGMIEELVAKAPSQFTQLARNPERNVVVGGDHIIFAPVYGPPFIYERERGRRDATLQDFQDFVKLAYRSDRIHHSGGTIVEPVDVPVPVRHLDMLYSHIRYSDKPFMGSVTSAENAADSVHMAEIVFGAKAIWENPALLSLINVNSPRRYDDRMLGALKVYARARQAVIITPFILAGAMSPVSLAGTLAQQNAEALAGIALTQLINPGMPVVYGSFLTNIDLQSGSPSFGTPESALGLFVSAQLARRYHLPFRGGGAFTSSKLPDAQAAYESAMTLWPTVMANTNFVLHAAGWLDGGLAASFEKFVLDTELLGMMRVWMNGIELSDESFALDALEEVGPGGHYLGAAHTMRHFRTAFYRPILFENASFEEWEAAGQEDAYTRATRLWKHMLATYERPLLDEGIDEALQDFIARRKTALSKR